MVLVDTSIWVAHFREGSVGLEKLLRQNQVACHPFIIGELASGNLKNRVEILGLLESLPKAVVARGEEVLRFIEDQSFMGKGLGYIDMHLLASALLSRVSLWTQDKRLDEAARQLSLSP